LREDKKLTAEQVIAMAKDQGGKWSRAKLTRIENNEWTRPDVKDVEVLLDIYGVTDQAERESYAALAKQARQRGWWVSYSDAVGKGTYVGLEIEASRIRTYEAQVVPGLLQTESYARAVIRAHGVTDEAEIDRRVEAREMRKQILAKSDAPRIWAIIDEAALHRIPDAVREEQVRYLIDVQRAWLRVQVLPFGVGLHPATAGSFVLLDFPEDPPLVYREDVMAELFYEDRIEVEHCAMVYDHVAAAALSVEASAEFLERMIQ
jgi:hypothetical protein